MSTDTLDPLLRTVVHHDDTGFLYMNLGELTIKSNSTRTTDDVNLFFFGENVRSFIQSSAKERESLRPKLESTLVRALNPSRYLSMALDDFVKNAMPERLDDAVDILYVLNERILSSFTLEALSSIYYTDDHLYCLILALSKKDKSNLRSMLTTLLASTRLGVREAVVETLGQWGDQESRSLLVDISKSDESTFIRELAADILDEVGE